MKKYWKAQRLIKQRRQILRVRHLWDMYGCSCGHHNMRGDR